MKNPQAAVRIVEVGPRDGLQNIKEPVPTSVKIELVRRLRDSGLRTIELTSIVSPRAVPQLADCREVLGHADIKRLHNEQENRLPVLVPNLKGLNIAIDSGVREVAVFISATEGFSKANINCSVADGIERAGNVVQKALSRGLAVRGYVSCIFADPSGSPTDPSAVLQCVKALLGMGCYEVSLGDTVGVGCPTQVRNLLSYLVHNDVPVTRLAGHFHDTHGHAAVNAWEAYHCGIRVFDSSIAGLGGCPFAPGSKGNVATEDLVFMFHKAGIDTGVNLARLVKTGTWISRNLQTIRSAGQLLPDQSNRRLSGHAPTRTWSLQGKKSRVSIYRSDGNVKLVLNRVKTGNTITQKMINHMTTLIDQCNSDDTIHSIAITGSGQFFCMGVEYGNESASPKESDELKAFTKLLDLIDKSPKTTIACINGPAFGAGVCLALSCKIRIAVKAATLTMGEAKWTASSSPAVTPRREATILARPVTTSKLKSLGIVEQVVNGRDALDDSLEGALRSAQLGTRVTDRKPSATHDHPMSHVVSSSHKHNWMDVVMEVWHREA
ncbi:hypothetical protein FE257_000075 [Aspergillus nanangensis]|uniref:hydroxymethylglutaryl-CoA lyase n=1 Tax=Aspergillus nanangensis TaxID=2582783 RepID=A0AAD4D0G7_ASPNN|nr:hypothetical protein FE257_000075 [Aspergillus nanangensis]